MTALQVRDLNILEFIARFGYAQERHIARLCGLSLVQTKRIVNRLTQSGYLRSCKILANLGNYVFLTAQGGKMLGIKVVNTPSLNTLNHDTLLIDLYFFLIDITNESVIKTDKQIRREFGIFEDNSKQRVPDLLIGDNVAVELELSEKPKSRLQEIINTYITDDSIKLVCYFLQSLALLNKIKVLADGNAKFRFFLLEVSEDNRFTNLRQQAGNELIKTDMTSLFELPQYMPKCFGNYHF